MQAEDAGHTTERQRPAPIAWDYLERRPDGVSVRIDRIKFAAHEAGHAVVGFYVGHRIPPHLHVFIEQGSGTAQLRDGSNQARLVATLAGRAGEAVLLPDLVPTSWSDEQLQTVAEASIRGWRHFIETGKELAVESDDEIAMGLIVAANRGINPDAAIALFRQAEAEAIRIASIPAVLNAIESVMLALLHHERLTGAEVDKLIVMAGHGCAVQ